MLTVATWNLENFFRPGTHAGPTSDAAYEVKLSQLRATIEAIAPDILGVQEVGQPEALEDLRAALDGAGTRSPRSTPMAAGFGWAFWAGCRLPSTRMSFRLPTR